MPAERYFLNDTFKEGEMQELKGQEFHHLAHVMRTRKGESVELVNGKGSLAQALVQEKTKDKALLRIEEVYQEPEPLCRLILAQALPKPHRLDDILEKGTELGVDSFWLFPGEYSTQKECYPSQMERARTVTIAAMKQCGRLYLPSLLVQPVIGEWKNLAEKSVFFGDVNRDATPFETTWNSLSSHFFPVVFVTGPEGGFSSKEVQSLRDQGALGVKLHTNILRSDTASLMALSLLSHWLL